ncbi:sugar ABC transporter permease [Nocardiopsis exhalans]|uniref:Sugar ABC transporter permease n=1 Tax=Nocardiopsis exhalans TaxID=163604 RepID=A0ABY5DH97_9ACTN|nr:sugar ABC transporter permease [Nocardiopsis exhalans]USY22542.1 sugar ABC transporter permease [Nocardiopsis exhalans]
MCPARAPVRGRGCAREPRAAHRSARLVPYAFMAPAVVLSSLLILLPIAYTIYLSLRRVEVSGLGLGAQGRREFFTGLTNYHAAVTDPELWAGTLRIGVYGLMVVPLMLGLALLFALVLDHHRVRYRNVSRMVIFLPYAVPAVIATLLWGFLYLPEVSPLHQTLAALGLPGVDLMGQRSVFAALTNIAVWGGTGFNMLVLYTALRAVPPDLYEAARIDGASELQMALRIKIPMLTPALIMTALFSMIATLQVFSEPVTLSPLSNAISTTWSPLMKVYRDAFVRDDIHLAAATSVIIAAVTLVLSFAFLRLVQSRAFTQEER